MKAESRTTGWVWAWSVDASGARPTMSARDETRTANGVPVRAGATAESVVTSRNGLSGKRFTVAMPVGSGAGIGGIKLPRQRRMQQAGGWRPPPDSGCSHPPALRTLWP